MNPYKIEPPFYVSFSGGRTSGYMLRMILDAWGGTLPEGGHVLFANTGREHPATLDFVHEIETRWCPITWIEYRATSPGWESVNYATADQTGRHFADMIRKKQRLPSPPMRFCTSELKVKPMESYMKSLGLNDFVCIMGIRADEPRRVARIRGITDRDLAIPLADARVTEDQVLAFWKASDFDLPWPHDQKYFGNCDLCFLKSNHRINHVLQEMPERAKWWIQMEEELGHQFRFDRPSIKTLLHQVTIQGQLFPSSSCETDDTLPCDCTE